LYGTSIVDLFTPFSELIHRYNLPNDLIAKLGSTRLKEIINEMPTRRIDLHLHKQILKNPSYSAKITDLEDWGSLIPASCYCDVVVCEKHMADMLKRDGFITKARVETDLEKALKIL
jgi:hypothetical protein